MPAVTSTLVILAKQAAIRYVKKLILQPSKTMGKTIEVVAMAVVPPVLVGTLLFAVATKVPAFLLTNDEQNTEAKKQIAAYVKLQDRIYDYAVTVANDKADELEAEIRAEFEAKYNTPTPQPTPTPSATRTPVPTPPPWHMSGINRPNATMQSLKKENTQKYKLHIERDIQVTTPTWRIMLSMATVYAGQDFTNSRKIEDYIEKLIKKNLSFSVEDTQSIDGHEIYHTITIETASESLERLAKQLLPIAGEMPEEEKSALIDGYYDILCYFDEDGNELKHPYYDLSDDGEETPIITQPGCVPMPYFNQGETRWNYRNGKKIIVYPRDRTIKTSGCGPTSMAMIVVGLTGDISVNPLTAFDYAVKHGYYKGNGTYPSFFPSFGKKHNIEVASWKPSASKIIKALEAGHPIVAHMGPSTFTKGGHFVVLRGLTEDGKILVNDPGSKDRTKRAWNVDIFVREAKGSFWECWIE